MNNDKCEYCKKEPRAFKVKHPETCVHWRCLGCFRDLVRESPVVVVGVQSVTWLTDHERDLVRVARATRLLVDKKGIDPKPLDWGSIRCAAAVSGQDPDKVVNILGTALRNADLGDLLPGETPF